MSENGSWKLRISGDGADWVGKVMVKALFYFAMEIRGSERHLSGNEDYFREREESEPVLTLPRWQFASSGQTVQSSQWTEYCRFMLLLGLRSQKGSVRHQCARFLAKTNS